jgi:hypothetical protein
MAKKHGIAFVLAGTCRQDKEYVIREFPKGGGGR